MRGRRSECVFGKRVGGGGEWDQSLSLTSGAKMAYAKPDEGKNEKYDRDDRRSVRLYSNAV